MVFASGKIALLPSNPCLQYLRWDDAAYLFSMKDLIDKSIADEMSGKTDPELVEDCLNGDSAAWETLVVRYQRLIYSIPVKLGFSQDDAADVFQSICLKLVEKLESLRDHNKLGSWLITATTRECWRKSALSRREVPGSLPTGDLQDDDLASLAGERLLPVETQLIIEQQQLIREAVSKLPERCRLLITMLFYEKDELSYADIARLMKMPVASVGPTRARCLQKLKKLLDGKL
jgi:RNA polymerase sigma factor (sigma-70 family)